MSKNVIEPKLRIKEHKITNAYNFTYMIVLEKIKLRIWWGLTLIFREMVKKLEVTLCFLKKERKKKV